VNLSKQEVDNSPNKLKLQMNKLSIFLRWNKLVSPNLVSVEQSTIHQNYSRTTINFDGSIDMSLNSFGTTYLHFKNECKILFSIPVN